MSLWNDIYGDNAFEIENPHGINGDEWRTKDGRMISIRKMSTSHIINVMNIIGDKDDFWYVCKNELKRREKKQ